MSVESRVKGGWSGVVSVLRGAGVSSVFGLPGDDLKALDALIGSGITMTICRDQRNAMFMATGYAMQSGEFGVAFVGKGPAVSNTLTGLLEARGSAAPVLLISGGTRSDRSGSGAFQELDQLSLVRSLVKWAARVEHPDRLAPLLRRALLIARDAVPGPVYLEIPDHLLEEEIPLPADLRLAVLAERPQTITMTAGSPALRALLAANRPIVLVGGGVRHCNRDRRVERFAKAFGAAVACTASGRGSVDESLPLFCGLSGLYTPLPAASLWADTDCVIALGSRLEETATFGWPERLGKNVPVIQVNVDAGELATDFSGPAVIADAGAVLDAWMASAATEPVASPWTARVCGVHRELRAEHREALGRLTRLPDLHIAEVLAALNDVLPEDRILVQENGLQDMWSYRFPVYACDGAAGAVVPSEQTSLGFGAAAAIGVKRAAPDRPVVAFVGDGAFGVFDADLPTALEEGGLLYVVLNNGGYGWLQAQLDQGECPASGLSFVDSATTTMTAPEFPGLHQITVTDTEDLRPGVTEAWRRCTQGQVVVLNIPVRLDDALFVGDKAGGDFPVQSGPA